MIVKRQGLAVWFKHKRNLRQLKRFGHLVYASTKMRYAIVYVDQDRIEQTEEEMLELPFVSKVERSYKPYVATTYDNPKVDEAKLYDYKMGI